MLQKAVKKKGSTQPPLLYPIPQSYTPLYHPSLTPSLHPTPCKSFIQVQINILLNGTPHSSWKYVYFECGSI